MIEFGEKTATLKVFSEGEIPEGRGDFSYTLLIGYKAPDENYPTGRAIPKAKKYIRYKAASTGQSEGDFLLKKGQYSINEISDVDIIDHFNNLFMFQLRGFIR